MTGRRTIVLLTAVTAAAAVSAYAFDESRREVVASGISVAGVDLGGTTRAQATRTLERRLASPLRRPLIAVVAGRRFRISPEQLAVRVDVSGMVAEAISASRAGNFVGRTVRALAGQELSRRLPLRAEYKRRALHAFVHRVERAVAKQARNADVRVSPRRLVRIRSKPGRALAASSLRRALAAVATDPRADRVVSGRVRRVTPRLTTAELDDRYPYFITVDRSRFQLRIFRRLRLARTYRVGIGRIGFATPSGRYHIENKAVDPTWYVPDKPWAGDLRGRVIPPGPDNPIKARWLGFYDGAGIHGTSDVASIGTRASRGCVRMRIADVKAVYRQIPVGTPIYLG